jgi:hypothetical protein
VRLELPNLRGALHELLTQGDIDSASDMATAITQFLTIFGMWRERDEIQQKVAQATHLQQATGFTRTEYLRESNLGEAELQRGNGKAAYNASLTCSRASKAMKHASTLLAPFAKSRRRVEGAASTLCKNPP